MASLFKRGGKGNWIVQWYDSDGRRQTKSTRTTDHAAATRIANKYEADVSLRREGVIDARLDRIAQQSARPISEHLDDFGASMRSRSGLDHIDDTRKMIDKLCEHTGWKVLREIEPDGANRYAEHLFSIGRSAGTVHSHLTAIRSFVTWVVRTARLTHDPLATVANPSLQTDRRVIRRYLSQDEFTWLDRATRSSGDSFGMTATSRALLYATAIQTGLRSAESRSLTQGNCYLPAQSAIDSSQFPRENVVLPTIFGEEFENSGGGIRTPDTRIMIPLL